MFMEQNYCIIGERKRAGTWNGFLLSRCSSLEMLDVDDLCSSAQAQLLASSFPNVRCLQDLTVSFSIEYDDVQDVVAGWSFVASAISHFQSSLQTLTLVDCVSGESGLSSFPLLPSCHFSLSSEVYLSVILIFPAGA